MDDSTVNRQYQNINRLIDEHKLKDALRELSVFLSDMPEWDIKAELENAQTSYHYMLQYMEQGIKDPERDNLYRKLLITAYQLADKIRMAKLTPVSTYHYFERKRFYKIVPLRTLPVLQMELESYTEDMAVGKLLNGDSRDESKLDGIRKRHEDAIVELFNLVWLADKWTQEEETDAITFLTSPLVQVNDLSLFISALTLSLMEQFDIRKLLLLLDAYIIPATEVNQRAIVGIALILFLYDNRLNLYPEVADRLAYLGEKPNFVNDLSRVQIQLLRCRETEKITKKMREEIIPEMMRNVGRINPKMGEESDEDGNADDKNPDWQDWMEQSGMSDKLKEMSELQMEGADVYMSTFAQLKGYPFFREISNWFYPFDTQHSAVVNALSNSLERKNTFLNGILQSGFFCNSDKYSFCFTIMQIPEAQRNIMSQQLDEQNNAMNENKRSERLAAYAKEAETISNQYIHDLYRFFKVYPRRHEFNDIFRESLNLQYCKTLEETLGDTGHKLAVAGYLFHKNYFVESCLLYEDIVKEITEDSEIYQKIGYCLQKLKNYQRAINAYLQADLLKPDNVWTNRHLAMCYRQLRQSEKALEYYKKVEEVQPESLPLLSQIGHCLADLKRYEEALAYFFKVEYFDSKSAKVWRAIAWCSFVTGKYEQAKRYYNKLLGEKPEAQDYLNAGHTAWVSGNMGEAVKYYTSCADYMSDNWETFSLQFNKDKEDLLAQGILEKDIPLMLDLIKFHWEND